MYTQPIHVVTMEVTVDDVEPVCEALRDLWDVEPVQTSRPRAEVVWLDLYFEDEVEARLAEKACAAIPGVRSLRLSVSRPDDWEKAFRKQFKVLEVGEKLRVVPVWEEGHIPDDGRIALWVDPGLSFGTGQHFTTSFCLEMIDRLWLNSAPRSFLDVGTGSGLLAIAAARLGCPRVVAIENDSGVLDYARSNFERNEVDGIVELQQADVREVRIRETFDLVCANLISGLLIDCAADLVRCTAGHLVVSGIRDVEADGVADAFLRAGAEEVTRDGEGEWVGMMFRVNR